MSKKITLDDIDQKIFECLTPSHLSSFFLFAGAGSGKTRTLINVLDAFKQKYLPELQLKAKKIAVITYTNAACDEIKERLEFDTSFHISTIHSFVWELIKPFTSDIKDWLFSNIMEQQQKNQEEQKRGRAGTKAAIEREVKIANNEKRLKNLESIKFFTYSPAGINNEKESLSHTEVIKIATFLLSHKPLLQKILIGKYPILLIDETQDTQKDLINVFIEIQKANKNRFCLGLLGDLMQRIYSDGKENLTNDIPDDWITPEKIINHRSLKRIVKLINKIRSEVENHQQCPFKEEDGVVRLFLIDTNQAIIISDVENKVMNLMSEFTEDIKWRSSQHEVKTLTLEHHMAAQRGGFNEFFIPLYKSLSREKKTGLIDGSLSNISFLTKIVLPLMNSIKDNDQFAIAQIVKKNSDTLSRSNLSLEKKQSLNQIKKLQVSVDSLKSLYDNHGDPTLLSILSIINDNELFNIPEQFLPVLASSKVTNQKPEFDRDGEMIAWENALNSPLSQLAEYTKYINDESRFDTHQGVKGLQFPRVMVILDDDESRGFLFSYDKLFGVEEKTITDLSNENEGKETSIDRTRRLFYVICSRAEESLAIVAYTKNVQAAKNLVLEKEWFSENEIILI